MSYPCENCIISMTCEDDCDRISLNYDNFIRSGRCPDCGHIDWLWYYANHTAIFKCKNCRANFRTDKRDVGTAKTSVWTWYIGYDKDKMPQYFFAIVRLGKGSERTTVDNILHPISSKQLLHVIKRKL